MHAGHDLLHAFGQGPLVLVEPADIATQAGVFQQRMLPELHVAPHGHEVDEIVGEQVQPLAELSLIEQFRLGVEEVLHLLLELEIRKTLHALPPWCAKQPTSSTVPEITAASSESRKATAFAMSCGVALRPATVPATSRAASLVGSPPRRPTLIPVTIPPPPGMTMLTRMWSWKWS